MEFIMKFVSQIKPILEQAGKLVLSRFRSKLDVAIKSGGSIVTEVDLLSEGFLKQELSKIIPGSGFYSEESPEEQGNSYRWVIDPIDGTKNFACGIPYFCLAVALEYEGEVVAAVTFAPALQEWFYAEKGCGMWHNDIKIELGIESQNCWKIRTALLIDSGSSISRNQIQKKLRESGYSGTFRYYGALALDLGYVASGSIDSLIAKNVHWWDVAGGLLMVQEAGKFVKAVQNNGSKRSIEKLYAGNEELYHLLFEKNNSF